MIQPAKQPSSGSAAVGHSYNDVPEKRGSGERKLEDAIAALAAALEPACVPWMIIGGLAILARGVRRMTTDVDVTVRGDFIGATKLVQLLAGQGIEPRIADALKFAEQHLVLLLRHSPSGVDIDLSFGWTSFEHEAIAGATREQYGTVSAPVASAQSLVILKLIAGRPKDLEDAAALLLLHPDIDPKAVRRDVAQLAELAEAPEVIQNVDTLLRSLVR